MSLVEASSARSPHPAGPLVVDLDGSLVRTDTMVECIMALMRHPVRLLRALCEWRHGRARLKQALADEAMLEAAHLPYNEELVTYLREQQAAGRVLVLATGADRRTADAVATHLDLFDQVLASDGDRNVTGSVKLAAIRETIGTPFSYVGDSHKDLGVWCDAASGICVNARKTVSRAAARMTTIERTFLPAVSWQRALLRALRPHQWSKNLLVFVPLVAARAVGDFTGWAEALLTFVAFCCTSSGIYLINDLSDLSADRRHPNKRRRPLASGALPLHIGMIAAPLLLMVGLGLSATVDALHVLASYALLSCGYSLWLKSRSLIDVFTLAALYGLRLVAGGAATGYHVSLWLLAFSSFLFLGLAMVKRVAELMVMPPEEKRTADGRGYSPADLPIMQLMGVASSFIASLVLALYVQNELISAATRRPTLSWIIVPLILFWQCRIWLATSRGEMHDDPIVFAARDWVSWVVAAACFGVLLLDNVVGTWRLAAAFL